MKIKTGFGPVNHPALRYDRTAPRSFDSLPPSIENKNASVLAFLFLYS
ncbi:hypothetical protein L6267_04955 [Candidatus Parcubacteria bacterium]|nr:hypothetical protein [Candidatus Parcubacteria bacterium]